MNKKEDWCVKSKWQHIKITGNRPVNTFQRIEYNMMGGAKTETLGSMELKYFCPTTIMVLREKLLEDISKSFGNGIVLSEFKKIIERRFGDDTLK